MIFETRFLWEKYHQHKIFFSLRQQATEVCDRLSKITNPTLIVAGTEDITSPPANSVMLAEGIPGAWLVQIKDGGHELIFQYPNEFSR